MSPETYQHASRPNIVLILADDLGKTDISLYGSPYLNTPNIDAIGKNGIIFDQGYITSPICSPSRAGLMTGRYQQRFGYEFHVHNRYPKNRLEYYVYKYFIATGKWQVADREIAIPTLDDMLKQGLPPTEYTLAEILKKYHYATAILGKWHLGYNDSAIPINRGFDYQYGFYEAHTLYDDENDPDIVNQKHDYFSDYYMWKRARNGNCAIRRNHKIIHEEEYLTTKIAKESIAWIEKNKDRPFFAYIPFSAPHTPFQVPQKYFQQFKHIKDRNKRVYYGMIKALDDAVGMITQSLKNMNLDKNTLLIFLSDNGGATYTHATKNEPLKGGKLTNFEGGINIPFMMQWPTKLPANQHFSHPISALDIFPTIVSLIGGELPPDKEFDGVNLMPYLLKQTDDKPHQVLYWRSLYHKAIRKNEWKMIQDDKSHQLALYNLITDKEERKDVSTSNPDILNELQLELKQWEKNMIPPRWPRVMDFKYEDGDRTYYFPL